METEDGPRVLGVRGQGHSAVGRDAQVLPRRHVTKPDLLLPANDVTCSRISRSHHVHYVTFQGQKRNFWANFDTRGLIYPAPFTDEGQIWCIRADARPTLHAKFRLSRFILSPCGGEKIPNFVVF